MSSITSRLNEPRRRIAFLVFVLGIAICAGTFVIYEIRDPYIGFLDAMFNRPFNYYGYKIAMAIGLALAGTGYITAFHYDSTVGRIIRWIKTGK
jgi:hypothetical protein